MTTQRAGPVEWTELEAYKEPISSMQLVRRMPPTRTTVRRANRSARSMAGILIASMRIAESPEARKEAVVAGRPAWAKRVGAYYVVLVDCCLGREE